MLKRIGKTIAMFEILEGNEKIYVKGYDEYLRAIDCTFTFTEYGEGMYFHEIKFYIEIEDTNEL